VPTTITPWTERPEAASLLAECAHDLPPVHERRDSTGASVTFSKRDPRVRRLHEIADWHFENVICPAHNAALRLGQDATAIREAWPSVEDAIEAAIARAHTARAAA